MTGKYAFARTGHQHDPGRGRRLLVLAAVRQPEHPPRLHRRARPPARSARGQPPAGRGTGPSWPGCWSSSGGGAPRRPGTATAAPWPPGRPGARQAAARRVFQASADGAVSTSTPRSPTANDHEVPNSFRRRPASACHAAGCLPPAEGDVDDAAGAVHGLDLEPFFEPLQPVPEPLPAAQHDRHHDDVRVVDQVGGQEFADGGRAAAVRTSPPAAAPGAPAQAPGRGWRRGSQTWYRRSSGRKAGDGG